MEYTIGSIWINNQNNEKIRIIDKKDAWGYVSYKVYGVDTDSIYYLSIDDIIEHKETDITEKDIRRWITAARVRHEFSQGRISKLSQNIIPLPHQVYVLNRVLERNKIRFILADEVGLGKTIEAGLVIKELKTRGLIKITLVICPTGLVTQWRQEMIDKFDEDFKIVLPSEIDTIKNIIGEEDVYNQFSSIITPMDSIKPLQKRKYWSSEKIKEYNEQRFEAVINGNWDLIIIDEAHRVSGSSSDVARFRLGKALSEASPYLLLLTATPHNGKSEPFLRLVRLLDRDLFPNQEAITKEQVSPFVIRTKKREAIDNNGKLLFKKRNTKIKKLRWTNSSNLQKELYEKVTYYVANEYRNFRNEGSKNPLYIFLLIMMQRMVTSSTAAIRLSLEKRIEVLTTENVEENQNIDVFSDNEIENPENIIEANKRSNKEELERLKELLNLAKQAEYQAKDVKLESLKFLLENIKFRDKDRKIIIFTEFIATQEMIKEQLESQGYVVSIIKGSLDVHERNKEINKFRDERDFLVSTDAGGEGLNLQFADCVINYDLPWNPMKIEQRIGRVDRIGQKKDVDIYNLVIEDTVESRVREVLEEKLSTILKQIGIDKYSDVLDGETADINYTNIYMESLRLPNHIEKNIEPLEKNIRNEIDQALSIRNIIDENKKLETMINEEINYDVEKALEFLIKIKNNNKITSIDQLSNEELQRIVLSEQMALSNNVPVIKLKNFSYENGFFSLWSIRIQEDDKLGYIQPVFMNEDMTIRPLAGNNIWDFLLEKNSEYQVVNMITIDKTKEEAFRKSCEEYSTGQFIKCRDKYLAKVKEDKKKALYASELRLKAAKHIGIDNIRESKIKSIMNDISKKKNHFKRKENIFPNFEMIMFLKLEK